jgi:hypothetical protein
VRQVAVIVSLCAGLLVVAAIVGAVVRDDTTDRLDFPAYAAMARSIGVGVPDFGGGDQEQRLCGTLPDDADGLVRLIDTDCRVSVQMAQSGDALSACDDAACAREVAPIVVRAAQRAEQIERLIAHSLEGDCRTFFRVESDYDHGIAQAADRLAAIPDGPFFVEALGTWKRDRVATEDAIDRQPVLDLLAACHP